VLVQELVAGGTEVILGVNNDPLFGPALMFGLGGIFAEVLKDVTFRLAPITRSEALEMIHEIRAFKVLDGARGRPKADIPALADAILRLSALATDLSGEVAELDVNPLFVLPAGFGVKAADALIKPKGER
jgi:acyl-CoA synthetase (NDP forming)